MFISELLGGEIPQFLDSPKMLRYVINYALNIKPHPSKFASFPQYYYPRINTGGVHLKRKLKYTKSAATCIRQCL